jgi:hypothetical protein
MKVFTKNKSRSIFPDSDIFELQKFLQKEGYGKFIPSGVYGPATQSAIAKFQKEYLISPSVGNFGSVTRRKVNLLNFSKNEILAAHSEALLGIDISPIDRSVDNTACVESFLCLYEEALGERLSNTLSTIELDKLFKANPKKFKPTNTPKRGTIIISPTESPTRVGHVGNLIDSNGIISNSSSDGKQKPNFTYQSWLARYKDKLKLQVYMYDII